ncbi:MAG: outer membrane beta-barrel protein [Pseudomonadota bacterium]
MKRRYATYHAHLRNADRAACQMRRRRVSPRLRSKSIAQTCSRRSIRLPLRIVWFAGSFAFASSGALAQSLRSEVGVHTDTPQETQNRKWWDGRKQYGAIGVRERDRQPHLPDGIRMGNYMVLPSGQVQLVHRDNLYKTSHNRISDFAIQVDPRIRFISKFSRHALNIDVGGRYIGHRRETNLDTLGGFANVEGALHINHAHTISFGLLTDYGHEEQLSSFQRTRANEYTPVWRNSAELGITRDAGRLSATYGVAYKSWDFKDVKTSDGDVLDQDMRDTTIY